MEIKFTAIKKEDIPAKVRKNSQNQKVLFEFIESGSEAAVIDLECLDYCDGTSAYNSFNKTVKRCGMPIKLSLRGSKLYLERTDI